MEFLFYAHLPICVILEILLIPSAIDKSYPYLLKSNSHAWITSYLDLIPGKVFSHFVVCIVIKKDTAVSVNS